MNKPLWLNQRDVLARYTDRELELPRLGAPRQPGSLPGLPRQPVFRYQLPGCLPGRGEKPQPGRAAAAFPADQPTFREHALPLSTSYTQAGSLYLADLWYYPNGTQEPAEPLVIDLQTIEAGYYHVPTYMAYEQGDLVFQVPRRSLLAIDSWVHIFIADVVFGLFARGRASKSGWSAASASS